MAAGNLQAFINRAMAYCWDESHGYSQQYDSMGHPGFDCSGLIGRCLYEAGFNYPATHVGTLYMDSALLSAGFMKLPFSSSFVPNLQSNHLLYGIYCPCFLVGI